MKDKLIEILSKLEDTNSNYKEAMQHIEKATKGARQLEIELEQRIAEVRQLLKEWKI